MTPAADWWLIHSTTSRTVRTVIWRRLRRETLLLRPTLAEMLVASGAVWPGDDPDEGAANLLRPAFIEAVGLGQRDTAYG